MLGATFYDPETQRLTSQQRDLYIGSAPAYLFEIVDAAGTPVDLTGATLWLTCKAADTDTDAAALFQKTNGAGLSITSAAGGTLLAQLTTTDTDASKFTADRSYPFDLQLLTSGGEKQTLLTGFFRAQTRITLT